ncbi:DUF5071 domain-containing protein [Chryseobacterium sp. KBW03]|uniref:DUF5071 domain-containing protein n=1 Tax=Chryseobacterium sp. KBW03 TaxID=2153362 RepID=UPI000F5AD408|nr:DUF5071 domain-containing protein [Chryseobacterium sp. KBW03]RQO36700.1 DUF5071 domain-containing protein [Chryseobacterium sp. KBW03]
MIENIQDLIPKNKGDLSTAEKLKNYSYEDLKEIIPNLLEWLQDLNWPVAKPVSEYLESIHDKMTTELLAIIKSNEDEVWKYWIITIFGPITESPVIKNEIIRIAISPTKNERIEEVDEVAKEIVTRRNWK